MGKMKELDIIHSDMQYDIDQLKEEVAKLESNTADIAEGLERMVDITTTILNVLKKHGLFDYTKEGVN